MVELLFPLTLREDMKDVFIHPRGLGLRGVYNGLRNVNIPASLMYLYYYGFHHPSSPKTVSQQTKSVFEKNLPLNKYTPKE